MAENLLAALEYPYDCELLLRKRKSLRRQLLARKEEAYIEKRIAILGGSTTADVKDMLELFLLGAGIRPSFYESEYNRFYEDAVFGNSELDDFAPEIVIIWTSFVNLLNTPKIKDTPAEIAAKLNEDYRRFERVWESLAERYNTVVIQNNIELPYMRPLGNLDGSLPQGICCYVEELNKRFALYAEKNTGFYLHDLHYLAAKIGLAHFYNPFQYYGFKFAVNYDAVPEAAAGLAHLTGAVLGKTKKCLVLDLDNTIWGGVIGDDGVENIQLGHETPAAEAYTEFQRYVLELKNRGVILAVCSKNDEDIAKAGFNHPDSVLSYDDFAAFRANWEPKDINIRAIAQEINIGLDSLVFIDDNPAERAIVRQSLPEVAVPEVDVRDVFSYIRAIEENAYFEVASLSEDDFKRNETYRKNRERIKLAGSVGSYEEYLQSLKMQAELAAFKPIYFDRIAQLTGKSNQFNLTTRRYTRADIENMASNSRFITLYGRLSDCFGDNGLIAAAIGEQKGLELHILLWLMSCRVLKRGMENVMLDKLVGEANDREIKEIYGYYYPTKKNKMVAGLYESFGFEKVNEDGAGNSVWRLSVAGYEKQGRFIKIL
ncbi:MAG: HAD-IIIC family phosphatase [Lachnospiraceae bacterium]|nr:HAD-IIIC family phosphatase [Lachnospiraceae bacterium]